MGKTRTRTETNQTSNVNSTTTPQTPGFISEPWQQFMGNAGNLAGRVSENPYQFAAPANDLQNRAATNAQNLGGWQGLSNTASNLALAGATGGPNLAGPAQNYQASQIPGVSIPSVTLPGAHTGQATSFQAPQIGGMQGYQAPQIDINSILSGLGNAPTVSGGSARAGTVGPAAQATTQNAQSADASQLIGQFENPYIDRVRNAALAQADANAGRVQAADAAQAAGAGAFGSSRYGIREAELASGLARDRASLDAGLLDSGFRTALDAALRQGAQDTGVNVGNADRFANVGMFNADQQGQNQRTQAGLDTNASIATAGNQTQAGIAQAGFARDFGLAGLDARTRTALTQAGLDADSNRFLSEANNNRMMQQGQFDYGAASQNADASNRFGLAGLDALNTRDLTQGGFDLQRGTAQAGLDLQRGTSQAGLDTDASRFAAEAGNTNQMFNAGQGDNYLNRLLSGAGLMYQGADSYGANSRGDAGTQSQIGNDQWNRDNYLAGLPLSLQQQIGGLYGQVPLGAFVGSNTTGTEQSNGTSNSVQSQGFGSMLGGLLGAGLSGWAGGGFGLPFKLGS